MSDISSNSAREELIGPLPVDFPDEGFSITMDVVDLGDHRYILLGVPLDSETYSIGDTVVAEPREDGGLSVLDKAEKSEWRTSFYYLPRSLVEGQEIETIFAQVEDLGGYHHQVFEGLIFICLPPGVEYNPSDSLGQN
jgi:hypothetical protein